MKPDIFETLGFTDEWCDLGIVTHEMLKSLEDDWSTGDDPYTEHYRWKAFADFMCSRAVLEPDVLRKLYHLGQTDDDISMGGAVMVNILNRKECPDDILNSAANSSEKFLRNVANRKLQK